MVVRLGVENVMRSLIRDSHQRIICRRLILVSEGGCLRQSVKLLPRDFVGGTARDRLWICTNRRRPRSFICPGGSVDLAASDNYLSRRQYHQTAAPGIGPGNELLS